MSVSVCSFVCPRAYLQNCTPIFTNGSVLLWRRCDKLRTSGFIDDVVLSTVSHVEDVDTAAASNVAASSRAR